MSAYQVRNRRQFVAMNGAASAVFPFLGLPAIRETEDDDLARRT